MADGEIEHELCANCKKEIPQCNYVMHTAHCARNITLCPICKKPVPKNTFAAHKKKHEANGGGGGARTKEKTPPIKREEEKNLSKRLETIKVNGSKTTTTVKQSVTESVTSSKASVKSNGLLACKYCELELPKLDLEDHENYCGTRTDKCIECGEFVMFKYKKLHEDSNHGFIKLQDEPGPRPSWDSTTQRSTTMSTSASSSSLYQRRSLPPLRPFDMYTNYNMADYIPPPLPTRPQTKDKSETYKDISRRLDCKTEYIRNLLHDSASITAPLRTAPTSPRNHFNHNKGPAPQPPSRRRNPPTELTIPCEFCGTPIPHEDLIQHETGCRPDLARFNARRRSPELDEFFVAQGAPASPEVELPCEFCSDMIPASQLLRHQATCM